MTSVPSTLFGTRTQPSNLSETDAAALVATRPQVSDERLTKKISAENLMVILLALWLVVAGVIAGLTAF